MPGSSRKHPPDKIEFIALTDSYPSQKSISMLQIFETLSQSTLFKCYSTLKYYLEYCSCTVMQLFTTRQK